MYIVYDKPGQLCNRIWSLVPLIAKGLEDKELICSLTFGEYAGNFQNLHKNKYVKFVTGEFVARCLRYMRRKYYIHNAGKNLFTTVFNIKFFEGWPDKSMYPELIQKHKKEIVDLFRISDRNTQPVDTFFDTKLSACDVIIGIHLRRDDYKDWQGGKYYYSNEVFYRIMKELKEELCDKRVCFVLCSNEKIDCNIFSDIDCVVIPDSSPIKDLYALSKCSYIIGPPSTFSLWASFYGEVPIKVITSPNEKIKLKSFSKTVALDLFENGTVLKID